MGKIKINIRAIEYIDQAVIDGLRHMENLKELDLEKIDRDCQEPFKELFIYARERMKLGGRDRHLPALISSALDHEPQASNWVTDTDTSHTVASLGYLIEICQREAFSLLEQKIVQSALIVHDCAYPRTKDFASFTGSAMRLQHMVEAEKEFRIFSSKINQKFIGFYSAEEIEQICAIVRQHDNPSVIKDGQFLYFSYNPPQPKLLWAHREADRLWMLDKAGFALDLIRRILESNPWYDPEKYLKQVIASHLVEAGKYQDNNVCLPYQEKKSLYRTKTGHGIFKRLIKERAEEYYISL